MSSEMFQSAIHPDGDVSGVFEYTDGVGYFYLYDKFREDGEQIISSIHIISGHIDLFEQDITISWNESGRLVGLYIKGKLWAVFDVQGTKYGGGYSPAGVPKIPAEVVASF